MKYQLVLTRILSVLISAHFVFLPTHTWAQTTKKSELDINVQAIRRSLELSSEENNIVDQKLARVNKLIDNIMFNNLDELKNQDRFFDHQYLPNQQVLEANNTKKLSLLLNQDELPNIVFDEIKSEIIEGDLYLNGFNNGKLIGSHIIPGLNAIQLVEDPEFIMVITNEGKVLTVEKSLMINNIFRAPFPVNHIISKINQWSPQNRSNIQMDFLTRGTRPFVESELRNASSSEKIYLTHDLKNEVVLNAGDLVIYEENQGSRKLKGIYSRQAIYNLIEIKTKELVALQMLYSFEGLGQTFAEKREELLQIGDHITHPIKELLEQFTEEEKIAFDKKKEQLNQQTLNPLVAQFLANSTRDQIKDGIKDIKSLKSKANKKIDQFTYQEWDKSFKAIKRQAENEYQEIQKRIAVAEKHQSNLLLKRIAPAKKHLEKLNRNKQVINDQIQNNQFDNTSRFDGKTSIDYQELLRAHSKGEYAFSEKLSPWYKKITIKKMKKTAKSFLKITSVLTATTVAASYSVDMTTDFTIAEQFKLLTDLYHSSIFPIVLDGVPYWQTAILGVTSLLAIIPLANIFGQMLAPMLESAKRFVKPGSQLHTKLQNLANTFKPISAWQTNVTLACRGYARLLLPYYHKLFRVFNQPTMSVMKLGINPFKRVEYAGKKRLIGFNAPVYFKNGKIDKDKLATINKERKKAISRIAKTMKQKEILAWTLATIVVSKQENIDAATLLGLSDQSLNIETLEKLHSDKEAKAKWQTVAREFLGYLNKNAKGVDLTNIDNDLIETYYNEVKRIAVKINKNSSIKNQLIKLKHRFSKMYSSTAKEIAFYGVEDYEFLNNIVASPFVAEQTAREFILDHAIVATVPTFVGERANPETLQLDNGRDIVAHNPEGFLGNSIQHNYDVFNNTLAHLLMAGPGTALVYQRVKPQATIDYNPVESYLLKANSRPEGFFKAAMTWTLGVLNFKSSNLGGYYLKSFLRRFTTLQASLTFTLIARVFIGGQNLQAAFMAYALFWFAGVLTYGWPWTIISRGNQALSENVARKIAPINQARTEIFDGLRNNDEELIKSGYDKLQNYYIDNFQASSKPMIAEALSIAKKLKKELPKKKIISLLKSGKETEAFTILAKFINDYNEKRYFNPRASKADLVSIRNGSADISNMSISEKARILLEESLVRPPVHNAVNKTVPWMTTFLFGAVFTTILAVSLTVMSFDPSKLTVGYIAGWAGKLALFYPIVFALTSSYTWNKISETKLYKRLSRFKAKLCSSNYLK